MLDVNAAHELINTGLLFGDLCIVYVLAHMMVGEMRRPGWLAHVYNQVGLALLVHFGGLSMVRAYQAITIWRENRAYHETLVREALPLGVVGSLLSFIGVLILVRLFSPKSWGPRRGWIIVLLLTFTLSLFTYSAV